MCPPPSATPNCSPVFPPLLRWWGMNDSGRTVMETKMAPRLMLSTRDPFLLVLSYEILETLAVAPNWRRWHTGLGSWVHCSPACFLLLAHSLCLLPATRWTADLCHMFPPPRCPDQAYGVSTHGLNLLNCELKETFPSLSCFSWVFWSQRCKSNEYKREDWEQSC